MENVKECIEKEKEEVKSEIEEALAEKVSEEKLEKLEEAIEAPLHEREAMLKVVEDAKKANEEAMTSEEIYDGLREAGKVSI